MQKLVKRRMHYETIMPVEAYHEEDRDSDWLSDTISVTLGVISVVAAFIPGGQVIGAAYGAMGIAHTILHDEPEYIAVMEGVGEAAGNDTEAYRAGAETIVEVAQEANEAIMEGFIDWSSDIDYDDPIVQAYGE